MWARLSAKKSKHGGNEEMKNGGRLVRIFGGTLLFVIGLAIGVSGVLLAVDGVAHDLFVIERANAIINGFKMASAATYAGAVALATTIMEFMLMLFWATLYSCCTMLCLIFPFLMVYVGAQSVRAGFRGR